MRCTRLSEINCWHEGITQVLKSGKFVKLQLPCKDVSFSLYNGDLRDATFDQSSNKIKLSRKTLKDQIHVFMMGSSIPNRKNLIDENLNARKKIQNRTIVKSSVTKSQSKLMSFRPCLMMEIGVDLIPYLIRVS